MWEKEAKVCQSACYIVCSYEIIEAEWHIYAVTHICVDKLTTIDLDNGQYWNIANWTNLSEIVIGIKTFSFKKMPLNVSSAKWGPFCQGLNMLSDMYVAQYIHVLMRSQ